MSHSRSTSHSERSSPLSVVASIWLVAVVLTGYCATDVHSWVHGSAEREDSPLPAIANALQTAGDATGLSAARGWLERVREGIYKDGEAAAAPAPQPPVVAQPPP